MTRDLGSGKLLRAAFLFAVFLMSASGQSLAGLAPIEKASRQWKIYIITHTHADIGYTDLIPEVERVWCQGIDQAISASEKGLKWTLEGSLLFDVYRRYRKPQKVERLVNLVREKKIEIASLYTNMEQEFAGPEELVRPTFYATTGFAENSTSNRERQSSRILQGSPGVFPGHFRGRAHGISYFLPEVIRNSSVNQNCRTSSIGEALTAASC